jgi:hypothetical protein
MVALAGVASAVLVLAAQFEAGFNAFNFRLTYPAWWAWLWALLPWVAVGSAVFVPGGRRRKLAVAVAGLALIGCASVLASALLRGGRSSSAPHEPTASLASTPVLAVKGQT